MWQENVNRRLAEGLAASPQARALCRELCGHALRVEIEGWPAPLELSSHGESLELCWVDSPGTASALVRGGPLTLLRALANGNAGALRTGGVQLEGDGELAERFARMLRLLRPDLEYELSRYLGHIPAHLLTLSLRSARARLKLIGQTALGNTAEALAHEKQWLVPRAEAEHHQQQVEALRDDLARLDARVRLLQDRAP